MIIILKSIIMPDGTPYASYHGPFADIEQAKSMLDSFKPQYLNRDGWEVESVRNGFKVWAPDDRGDDFDGIFIKPVATYQIVDNNCQQGC